MKSSLEQLRKRGSIEGINLEYYYGLSKLELLELLDSELAVDRTISARLLGAHHTLEVIEALISRLSIEKKLYTKIELTETLGNFGEVACKPLIKYLGKIGNNQHKALPKKEFKKKSYPLPRDIVARTICKIGEPALKDLKECLGSGETIQILEAVDAIGFISFYQDDLTSEECLLVLLKKYENDYLMVWKILRAFQSFRSNRVKELLIKYSKSDLMCHRLEALRSIKQIEGKEKHT